MLRTRGIQEVHITGHAQQAALTATGRAVQQEMLWTNTEKYLLDDVHALGHRAEHHVLAVQPCSLQDSQQISAALYSSGTCDW